MGDLLATLEIPARGLDFGGRRLFPGGLSFAWRRGRHWGLVGPNGCGKSVLVSLLSCSRWHPDAEAELRFEGPGGADPVRSVATVSLERQAAVMARYDAYAQMRWNAAEEEATPTLREWLSRDAAEGREAWEVRAPDPAGDAAFARRRASLVRALGLGALGDRRLAALSNGEMRRALLCRALLERPVLLLLDAPAVGLDGPSRDILFSVVSRLAKARRGPSVLFSTVRPEELPPGITDLLLLGPDGRVLYQGPAAGAPVSAGRGAPVECTAPGGAAAPRRREATVWRASSVAGRRAGRAGANAGAAAEAPALVEMRSVTVRYGDAVVFRDLDWTVRRGEKWLVSGPNGCGKSTLLALVVGDHPQAYSEDVRFFGRRRGTGESVWDVKKRVGWVSPEMQTFADGSLTVLDTVLSGLDDAAVPLKRRTAARLAKARRALGRVGLSAEEGRRVSSLSGGARRLAMLARAIVKEPPLLVLDEPCQNLDAKNRGRFLRVVDELCAGPETTLLFVTHLRDSVPRCIDHALAAETPGRAAGGRGA